MGSIYQRDKIWWIKYSDENNKPRRESSKSQKASDAKRLLKRREGEVAEGRIPSAAFTKTTMRELADDVVRDYISNKRKSIRSAERICRLHIIPFFGHLKAKDVTTNHRNKYVDMRLKSGACNGTINRELAFLKRMFSLGKKCTPPKVGNIPYIPKLKEDSARKGFFEHDDFIAVRDALPEYLKPLITFGYVYGWRVSEIRNLTWDKVDLIQKSVRLEPGETKNDASRTVYLNDELKNMFERLYEERNPECVYVFQREGQRIVDFTYSWKKACKEVGIKRMFHDLRRTAVRNLVRSGVPERVAMQITGHKTRFVFDRYDIVSPADLVRATALVTDYLFMKQDENTDDTGAAKIGCTDSGINKIVFAILRLINGEECQIVADDISLSAEALERWSKPILHAFEKVRKIMK
jgi:integrase